MKRKPLILISLLLAAFVINLDTTIVNVALPTLVRELHASNSQLQWVVDAFNLLFAGSVLAVGSLSDRFGRKGMLLAGLSVFGLASLAGGLMDSPGALIAARCGDGRGRGDGVPLDAVADLKRVHRARRARPGDRLVGRDHRRGDRARADRRRLAAPGCPTGAASSSRWRRSPRVAGVLVARYVPTSRDPHAPRTDRAGFALSTAMIALLVYTIIEAPNHGWGSARTLGSFALTAVLAAAFVAWERRTEQPMLDLSLFGNPRFTAASASVAISFFALSGFIFLVTQYFQFLKGYGPLSTGVRLLPVASFVAISSILGTKLAVRLGTKLVVASGLFSMAAFYLWVTTVIGQHRLWDDRRPDGRARDRHGPYQRARDRGDHGRGAKGQGRCRVGGQRRHSPARRHARRRRDRQRVRLALRQPAHGRAPDRDAGHRRADRARVGRRRAHRSQASSGAPAIRVLASAVHDAASAAFFHGFHAANYLAAGVAAAGAVMALALLPAQPTTSNDDTAEVPALGSPATAAAAHADPPPTTRRHHTHEQPGTHTRDRRSPGGRPRRPGLSSPAATRPTRPASSPRSSATAPSPPPAATKAPSSSPACACS